MKIGNRVSWTHVTQRGKSMTMILRKGVIVSIDDGKATVKKCSGRTEAIDIKRLRLLGQKSQITEFVEAVVANISVEK